MVPIFRTLGWVISVRALYANAPLKKRRRVRCCIASRPAPFWGQNTEGSCLDEEWYCCGTQFSEVSRDA
jgi:hypothetical protein